MFTSSVSCFVSVLYKFTGFFNWVVWCFVGAIQPKRLNGLVFTRPRHKGVLGFRQ